MVRADRARITCWKGAWFHWHTHHFLVLPVSAGAPQGIPPDILPHYIVREFSKYETTITGKKHGGQPGVSERVLKKTSKMERYLNPNTEIFCAPDT